YFEFLIFITQELLASLIALNKNRFRKGIRKMAKLLLVGFGLLVDAAPQYPQRSNRGHGPQCKHDVPLHLDLSCHPAPRHATRIRNARPDPEDRQQCQTQSAPSSSQRNDCARPKRLRMD